VKKLSILILSIVLLSGCAQLERFQTWYQDNSDDFSDAVMISTLFAIEGDDGKIDVDKARELYSEALQVNARIDKYEILTADQVSNYLRGKVLERELSPGRTALAVKFLGRLEKEIEKRATEINEATGKVQGNLVAVREVVAEVIKTLQPYQ
jgi:hypothetical protein